MRRAFALVVVSFVLFVALVVPQTGRLAMAPPALAATTLSGDINCDSSVDAADALAGLRSLAGLQGGDCLAALGDVNCSGAPNLADVLLLRQHVASIAVSLPDSCPAIASPIVAPEGSTTDLIEAALTLGTITKGQALAYHLAAALAPQNLPAQFRGAGGGHAGAGLFHEVATNWSTLSGAEQDALRPYLLPPASPGSWAESAGFARQAVQWETVGSSRVKVWWRASRPEDAAKAAAILQEVDSVVWPKIVNYMGAQYAPMSDAAVPNAGGDGRYDIYLVHNVPLSPGAEPDLGWISPQLTAAGHYECEATPTYMVVNSREALSPSLLSTVGHEFMHSVQFSYDVGDCEDYRWLMESTATWAESWLYPDVNGEHDFAYDYLSELQLPLEHSAVGHPHQYGSYLFWYYLEKKEGLVNAVRDAWAASSNPDSLAAIDSALSGMGGLKEAWPKSALYNWNRPPFDDFTTLDNVAASAPWNDTELVVQNASVTHPVPVSLGHMSQNHYSFTMGEGVRSITFNNSLYFWNEEYAKVQALVAIDGVWESEPRDWTDELYPHFCFDRPEERVTELVIIITNSNYEDRTHTFAANDSELVASPLGCLGWEGYAKTEVWYNDAKFKINVDLRFEPQIVPIDTPGDRYDHYDLVSTGMAVWEVSGMWSSSCSASGTMVLGPVGSPTGPVGDVTIDRQLDTHYIFAWGTVPGHTYTLTCENSTVQQDWPGMIIAQTGGGAIIPNVYEGDQLVLAGEYVNPNPHWGGKWEWRLTPIE